jgi:hypothetical protein
MVERQRRNQNKGGTMLQKAMELKQRKNLEPFKDNSFAALQFESLNQIVDDANIKIGNNKDDKATLINKLINLEKEQYENFVDNYPRIVLPANLEIDMACQNDPSTSSGILNAEQTPDASIKEVGDLAWTDVVRKGRDLNKMRSRSNKIGDHDRSTLEY